jgi:glycosyltransferase involved in cell wall biosynthesis
VKVSIFTPSHNPKYISETYQSIKNQPYDEWLVLLNNGPSRHDLPSEILQDPRNKIVVSENTTQKIGAIKHEACSRCSGDILLELDHDDLLIPPSILAVKDAFLDPNVVFAYSNCAEFHTEDKSPQIYNLACGWEYRDLFYYGQKYSYSLTPETTPYHVSIIYYAPNHLRAFRKNTYVEIGGHNVDLNVCDDQDLMCRLYMKGKFFRVPECCYLYRIIREDTSHKNTWLKRNAEIQTTTHALQRQYLHSLIEHWAKSSGLPMIDLGGAFGKPPGYISVDLRNADIIHDLRTRYPFEDNSIAVVRAVDFVEHVADIQHTMNEIYRILRPGGYALISVPSTDGRGAWQDPTHVSFWNQNSLWYWTKRFYANFIGNDTVRFFPMIVETHFQSEYHQNNNIPYVRADLIALKGDTRPMGILEI